MYRLLASTLFVLMALPVTAETYAEKLGWPEGSRVLMIHADDAGMSLASNQGCIDTFEAGTVTSASVMMTCPWVPHFVAYLKKNPEYCAGVHLTFTSEWDTYRWGPVSGRSLVPGLIDDMGFFNDNNGPILEKATPEEIETEIRAQIALAEKMGINISHIDSHMGTLFAKPEYFAKYLQVGIEKKLPVLIAGGHLTIARQEEGDEIVDSLLQIVPQVWEAGLPVLDDIDTRTYNWEGLDKKAHYIDAIRTLKPGVTWLNTHPTLLQVEGKTITDNREKLMGDYNALTDPDVVKAIEEEGVVLTSWKELMERRQAIK